MLKDATLTHGDMLTIAFMSLADVQVVGFAMYYLTYDPWVGKQLYLEEFYVMAEYRGREANTTIYLLLLIYYLLTFSEYFLSYSLF